MPKIQKVVPPARSSRGRAPLLSDAQIDEIARMVKAGDFGGPTDDPCLPASDTEADVAKARGRAAQRANGVKVRLKARKIESVGSVWPVDPEDPSKGFFWAVGPKKA